MAKTFNPLKDLLHFLLAPIAVYVHSQNTSLQKKEKRWVFYEEEREERERESTWILRSLKSSSLVIFLSAIRKCESSYKRIYRKK